MLNCSVFEVLHGPAEWLDYAMMHLAAVNYRDTEQAAHARHRKNG